MIHIIFALGLTDVVDLLIKRLGNEIRLIGEQIWKVDPIWNSN